MDTGFPSIATNSSDSELPIWNDNTKELEFAVVSPTMAYDGIVSSVFYTMFVPDYLVFKWWGESRVVIEDNVLGITDSGTIVRAFSNSINEFENGEAVRTEINITTSKVQNYSMSGLFVAFDITDSGNISLE